MVTMAGLGPPLFRTQMTKLRECDQRMRNEGLFLCAERGISHGLAMQKAKRYPVLSQLIALSETWKYSAAVDETEENVSHYRYRMVSIWSHVVGAVQGIEGPTSQLTTIFRRTNCARPQNRRL